MLHIIIDGYNLLHASKETHHDWTQLPLEEGRAAVLNFLITRRQPAREEITLVFDGSGELMPPRVTRKHGVDVVFSEPGINADEVIRRMVAEAPNPKTVLVVTADRQIKSAVLAIGAKTVSPIKFLQKAEEEHEKRSKAPPKEPREKYVGVDRGQVAQWRKVFGFDKEHEEDGGGDKTGEKPR